MPMPREFCFEKMMTSFTSLAKEALEAIDDADKVVRDAIGNSSSSRPGLELRNDSIRKTIGSPTTLTLKMNNKWKTSIVKTTEQCRASNTAIKGCYS
uniref:Phage protein n=2 Tax=Caenorhabditis tropicalis TaxID=1561998 RepID=A0A1I7UTF5_9PELO